MISLNKSPSKFISNINLGIKEEIETDDSVLTQSYHEPAATEDEDLLLFEEYTRALESRAIRQYENSFPKEPKHLDARKRSVFKLVPSSHYKSCSSYMKTTSFDVLNSQMQFQENISTEQNDMVRT
jgi:hypothetical protein